MSWVNRTDSEPSTPRYIEPKWPEVKVRVLRPFCIDGRRQETGSTATLAEPDARSLIAQGKAESLSARGTNQPKSAGVWLSVSPQIRPSVTSVQESTPARVGGAQTREVP